ncbi:MAG: sulfatase, partial [Candidatus Aminicenantes bacterium]|nr:sulfatase [Candidatus Aminicenantes bacterium]
NKIKLLEGFNFIEFRRKSKNPKIQFKIRTIRINDQIEDKNFHLPKDEKITHFYSAGAGEISLNGKGKLLIRKVEFINGKKNIHEKNIKAGFLSGTKKYSFSFQTLGFLQLSTISGHFNLVNYKFTENPQKKKVRISVLEEKPDIYIILIDACQASHLGVYGYWRNTSPNIDDFSKDSIVFENAYTNATFTRASVATIFTGFFPFRHKLWILTHKIRKGLFLLPEFLKKLDYRTAILTETANISRFFGFERGIDEYYKIYGKPWNNPKYYKNKMSKYFKLWIKMKGPLFTYVHFIAPHFPIIPPPPFLDMFKKKKSSHKENRLIIKLLEIEKIRSHFTPEEIEDVTADYDSTIRYVDSQVGKLFNSIKEKRSYESSLIIFTSDHGEALCEHGVWGHSKNVFEETSRIPLIVKFPAKMNLKGRIQKVTQLADIFPTIAEMFGKERKFDGQSLFESIAIKKVDDTFAFSISMQRPPSIGIRWRSWYYIIHQYNNKELL